MSIGQDEPAGQPATGQGPSADSVIPFPTPNDDVIPLETGIPLIDADPKVIARRLADDTWETRANFFSNIITGSITNATKIGELQGEGPR